MNFKGLRHNVITPAQPSFYTMLLLDPIPMTVQNAILLHCCVTKKLYSTWPQLAARGRFWRYEILLSDWAAPGSESFVFSSTVNDAWWYVVKCIPLGWGKKWIFLWSSFQCNFWMSTLFSPSNSLDKHCWCRHRLSVLNISCKHPCNDMSFMTFVILGKNNSLPSIWMEYCQHP